MALRVQESNTAATCSAGSSRSPCRNSAEGPRTTLGAGFFLPTPEGWLEVLAAHDRHTVLKKLVPLGVWEGVRQVEGGWSTLPPIHCRPAPPPPVIIPYSLLTPPRTVCIRPPGRGGVSMCPGMSGEADGTPTKGVACGWKLAKNDPFLGLVPLPCWRALAERPRDPSKYGLSRTFLARNGRVEKGCCKAVS